MSPRIYAGLPLIVGGSPAVHADCCCDPPLPSKCQCVDVDDSVVPRPNIIVDVDYNTTANALGLPWYLPTCSAPASCPDLVGSYTVGCGAISENFDAVLVCSNKNIGTPLVPNYVDFYYFHRVAVDNEFSASNTIAIAFGSGIGRLPNGTAFPTQLTDMNAGYWDWDQTYDRKWNFTGTDCEPTINDQSEIGPSASRYDSGCDVSEFTTDANWDT